MAHILRFVSGGEWGAAPGPLWAPSVAASFDRSSPLPADAERLALQRGVQFYRKALLLPNAERAIALATIVPSQPDYALRVQRYARLAPPYHTAASGDGQLGVFEGLTSDIDIHGTQPQSNGVRGDCVSESSASFAVRAAVEGSDGSDVDVATNLLNYAHQHAGFRQPWALGSGWLDDYTTLHTAKLRPWVVSGDAFGMLSWTTADHAYQEYFSDDDARGLLGAVATASLLRSERWHSSIVTAVLGNLRQVSTRILGRRTAPFTPSLMHNRVPYA